jgi:hypothetical protein
MHVSLLAPHSSHFAIGTTFCLVVNRDSHSALSVMMAFGVYKDDRHLYSMHKSDFWYFVAHTISFHSGGGLGVYLKLRRGIWLFVCHPILGQIDTVVWKCH